jgi:hypothetical protein
MQSNEKHTTEAYYGYTPGSLILDSNSQSRTCLAECCVFSYLQDVAIKNLSCLNPHLRVCAQIRRPALGAWDFVRGLTRV